MSRLAPLVITLVSLAISGAGAATAGEVVARSTSIPELKVVFGRVESRTVVPARARIGGTIREIRVTEGSEVAEGAVVALVADEKLALELDAATAKVEALNSQLDNARSELERAQQLVARGVATQARLDQARMLFEVVGNQIAAAQAEKAVVVQRAREGEVHAPAAGRVLTVPVTLGSVVLPGEAVARIASGQYYLRLSLPERHAAEIVAGDSVQIGQRGLAAEGGAQAMRSGRIVKVYPEIADGRVIADVEVDGIGDYFVNERTQVWIPIGSRTAITIPLAAVSTRHGIDYVRVATAQGQSDVAVVLGEHLAGDAGPQIEILTGLHDGDHVVLPELAQ